MGCAVAALPTDALSLGSPLLQDTVVAVRKGGDELVICNVEAEKYPEKAFSIDPAQEVDVGKHNWGNYFLAAYKGVFEHLSSTGATTPPPVGLQVMVHGTVPTGEAQQT